MSVNGNASDNQISIATEKKLINPFYTIKSKGDDVSDNSSSSSEWHRNDSSSDDEIESVIKFNI
jgi:hypothetical protein